MFNATHELNLIACSVAQQRLEGLEVSSAARADAFSILQGAMSVDEAIARVLSRPAHVAQIQQ